jgi:hypothetical protein
MNTASIRVLGQFASTMTIRQKNRVPLLIWNKWYAAIIDIGVSWKPTHQYGIARLGSHLETWMNLLHIFGAEGIIHSKYILEHLVNPEELPSGLLNPIAIQLNVAVLLAALAGCTTITVDANATSSLTISCENATLEFSSAGPMFMMGKYRQNLNYPTYYFNSAESVSLACRVAYRFLSYCKTPCPTDESLARDQGTKIFDHLREKCSTSNPLSFPSIASNIGLRVPAIALLAADTPRFIRVHPTKHCRIFEAVSGLVHKSGTWRNPNYHSTVDFGKYLESEGSSVFTISKTEFENEPFQGDRFSKRVFKLVEQYGTYKYLSLGFSWLGSKEDYLALPNVDEDRDVKKRPQWPPAFTNASFVLIDGVVEGSAKFLAPGASRPQFGSQEEEADFHTAVSCQLLEVDWWLGNNQSIAACETCNLLEGISMSDQEALSENHEEATDSVLTTDPAHAKVRALLVFRTILIAALFGLALDSSIVEGDFGNQIVLLG